MLGMPTTLPSPHKLAKTPSLFGFCPTGLVLIPRKEYICRSLSRSALPSQPGQGKKFGKNNSTGRGNSHADRRTWVEGRGKWKESETRMEVRESCAILDCPGSFLALQ